MPRSPKLVLLILLTVVLLAPLSCRSDIVPVPTPTPSSSPSTPVISMSPPSPNSPSTPSSPATINAILIGWDGAQRNHVNESLGKGQLPNLQQLTSEGNLVAIDIYRTTDTKAGWTQILTGYEPEVTGVYSNSRYQPIPKGYTVFERLENFFGKNNFITVAVIGKKAHVDNDGPQHLLYRDGDTLQPGEKVITENGTKYIVSPGKPYYNASPIMDVFTNGLEEDEKVGSKAIELLQQYKDKPFFFFVHFAQVDHKGHQFGENSKEYNDALISADTWTGKIVRKLKELGLYEKTLVYVTADHGFDEGQTSHNDAPYVFLGTNDPQVMRRGQRADITPTVLGRFGLDLGKIPPPLDGHSLTKPYQMPLWEAASSPTATSLPATALENTNWVLQYYGQTSNLKATLPDSEITLLFDRATGQVTGSAGVNRYFGTYKLDGKKLFLTGPLASTKMAGPQLLMDQENEYLATLQITEGYNIEAGKLTISCGSKALVFAKK